MPKLNKHDVVIQVSTGTEANITKATAYGWAGELALATDTGILYVFPSTEGTPTPPVEKWRADQTSDTAPNDDTTAKKITLQKLSSPPTNAAYIAFSNNPGSDTFYLVLEEG